MSVQLDTDAIRDQVHALIDAAGAPGATIALIVDGQRWSTGVGWATLDRHERMDADARFSVYSVTKTIIATIAIRLAETGALVLDAPVREYLSDVPVDTPVSLRQLLNHSGGIPDYGGLAAYHEAVRRHPETPWTVDEFLDRTMSDGLLFAPGQGWRYSNIGYMLLRLTIERVTGRSFRDAVRAYLSVPLGLPDLEVVESLPDVASLTPGYSHVLDPNGAAIDIIPHYHPGWVSHGLVASTASDLAHYLDALFAGRIVGTELLGEMLTAIPVGETHPWIGEPSYGLGVMVDPSHRFGIVAGHTGGGPGYSTAAYHFPDVAGHHVTAAALVNSDSGDTATDIVFTMAEAIG